MEEMILQYAPVIIIVLYFLFSSKTVVTPSALEKKHREILDDVEKKYATKENVNELKADIDEIKEKMDKIYQTIVSRGY